MQPRRLLTYSIAAIVIMSICPSLIPAQEPAPAVISFDEVWEKTRKNSPGQKEAALETQSSAIASNRSSWHWLPRAFAEYRYFLTNDPGTVLMSNMGQRSVEQSDFNPSTLNHPDAIWAGKGTIGVDLPVYEGGRSTAENQALQKMHDAKVLAEQYVRKYEFGNSAIAYGTIAALKLKRERLSALQEQVTALLAGYRNDLKSNPVEYSGILGLRALSNRLTALLDENESKLISERFFLEKITGNAFPRNWDISGIDILGFTDRYFPSIPESDQDGSYRLKEYFAYADSAEKKADGQKSVFLPTAGLFSNVDLYNGKRSTDHSYTAGFYVRMNIFVPTEYGSVEQARKESEAARAKAESAQQQEQVEREKLFRMRETLKSTIPLLRDSLVIINEQTTNSFRLFANGSIKALQLVEVLSRKTDLIENISDAETGYLSTISGLYILSSSAKETIK